jgi:hypothetical protein
MGVVPEGGRINDNIRRLSDHPLSDDALSRLASRQHGIFALDQLNSAGLSARAVQHRAQAGRLHRIHVGVYSLVAPRLLTREGWWMAAVLAAGPGAV